MAARSNNVLESLARIHALMDRPSREGEPWRLPLAAVGRFYDEWQNCEASTLLAVDAIISRGISATSYRGNPVGAQANAELSALMLALVVQELGNVLGACAAQGVDPRSVQLAQAAGPFMRTIGNHFAIGWGIVQNALAEHGRANGRPRV